MDTTKVSGTLDPRSIRGGTTNTGYRLSVIGDQPPALSPQPSTLNPKLSTLNPKLSALNPQLSTLKTHHHPHILNPNLSFYNQDQQFIIQALKIQSQVQSTASIEHLQ